MCLYSHLPILIISRSLRNKTAYFCSQKPSWSFPHHHGFVPTLILPCRSVSILFSSVGAKQQVCIYSWHACDEHTEFYQWGSQTPVGFRIIGLGETCLLKTKHLPLSPIHIRIKWWGPRIFIINMDPWCVGARAGGEKFRAKWRSFSLIA